MIYELTWVNLDFFIVWHALCMEAIRASYDDDDLMQRYLDVCNQALSKNKDRFPFKQILGAAQDAERERKIEVIVSGSLSGARYVMNIDGDYIVAAPHGDCADCQFRRCMDFAADIDASISLHAR